jgi:hypothetical protein
MFVILECGFIPRKSEIQARKTTEAGIAGIKEINPRVMPKSPGLQGHMPFRAFPLTWGVDHSDQAIQGDGHYPNNRVTGEAGAIPGITSRAIPVQVRSRVSQLNGISRCDLSRQLCY